jgi:predicted nucleotidyltransferase
VGAGGGTLADDDVELVVLEGGVEFFFEDGLEAVNLVEEEDLAFAEVGEDGSEVALDLEGGAGGLLEADVELVGDDGGEGGFAEAGGTGEKDVVEGFAAGAGGFEGDGELLFGFGLADEFLEAAGAELELEGIFVFGAGGGDEALGVFGVRFGSGGHAEMSVPGRVRERVWSLEFRSAWRRSVRGKLPADMAARLHDVLDTLRTHEGELRRLGVSHAAVFGSVARGEAIAESDVDVLVELDETRPMGLFQYARLKLYIDGLLDGAGDVVNRRTLKPMLRENILRDAISAF